MLAPQAHGTQLFFLPTPDFDFFGTFDHSPLHIFFSRAFLTGRTGLNHLAELFFFFFFSPFSKSSVDNQQNFST